MLTLTVFRRVAELHSFSAAARDLGLSNAAVSKHVAALEEHTRRRLLQRTTRRVSLTSEGASYLERARRILDDLAALDERDDDREARGLLRINAPLSFGLMHVAPLVPELLARQPGLQVDLSLSDRLVDLVQEGVDAVVRITRRLSDSTLVAHRLCSVGYALCASPAYLRAHGVPRTPDDLAEHACVVYAPNPAWQLGRHTVRPAGRLRIDNSLAVRDAVVAGSGLALLPRFYVDELLRARKLRQVLTDHPAPPAHVHVLHAAQRHPSTRLRAFIDFLREKLGHASWAIDRP